MLFVYMRQDYFICLIVTLDILEDKNTCLKKRPLLYPAQSCAQGHSLQRIRNCPEGPHPLPLGPSAPSTGLPEEAGPGPSPLLGYTCTPSQVLPSPATSAL